MSPELTQPDFAHLYRRAFKEYGTRALWNKRVLAEPTKEDAWWWRAPCALKATAQPGNWPNRLSEPVVPLSEIQIDVLRLLAAHRDPESYVAGATPLNRNTVRYSDDIDVLHDREERVAVATLHDVSMLETAGYRVMWLRQLLLLSTVEVTHGASSTRLEWVVDSDERFFPTMRDATLGTSCIQLTWP